MISMADGLASETTELHHLQKHSSAAKTQDTTDSMANLESQVDFENNRPQNEVEAVLFNYHEYTVDLYSDSMDAAPYKHTQSVLCINHFPSYINKSRRMVRVPRVANYPVLFSTYLPGTEPSAIIKDFKFNKVGVYDGQWYNDNSTSPLSLYFDSAQFKEIVVEINNLSVKATTGNFLLNIIMTILDYLSMGLFTILLGYSNYKTFRNLDEYVKFLNTKDRTFVDNNIHLISPTKNGFLSLDFEIDAP